MSNIGNLFIRKDDDIDNLFIGKDDEQHWQSLHRERR